MYTLDKFGIGGQAADGCPGTSYSGGGSGGFVDNQNLKQGPIMSPNTRLGFFKKLYCYVPRIDSYGNSEEFVCGGGGLLIIYCSTYSRKR